MIFADFINIGRKMNVFAQLHALALRIVSVNLELVISLAFPSIIEDT